MDKLYKMVQGYWKRFPNGIEPFQIVTRLLEECGEVAAEINHWEGTGLKRQKHGEPSKKKLANELRQAMTCLAKIAAHYSVEAELEESIMQSYRRMKNEGLIE